MRGGEVEEGERDHNKHEHKHKPTREERQRGSRLHSGTVKVPRRGVILVHEHWASPAGDLVTLKRRDFEGLLS